MLIYQNHIYNQAAAAEVAYKDVYAHQSEYSRLKDLDRRTSEEGQEEKEKISKSNNNNNNINKQIKQRSIKQTEASNNNNNNKSTSAVLTRTNTNFLRSLGFRVRQYHKNSDKKEKYE